MFDLGGGELLLILVAVLILFGPKKLPELAQGLGKGLRQFRKAQQDFTDQVNSALYEEERVKRQRSGPKQATNTVSRSSDENRIAPPKPDPDQEDLFQRPSPEDAPKKGVQSRDTDESPESDTPSPPSTGNESTSEGSDADRSND